MCASAVESVQKYVRLQHGSRAVANFFHVRLNSTAAHNSSLGIDMDLVGATLDLAVSKLTRTPLWVSVRM